MRSRPPSDHQDAVSRRLALLSAELAAYGTEAVEDELPEEPAPAWRPEATHESPRVASPVPSPVPSPGRHASRRPGAGVVPDTLRGRIALGPGQLAVVAVLTALGLAVTAWWVVRAESHDVVAAPVSARAVPALADPLGSEVPHASGVQPASVSGAAAANTEASGEVTVDVAGKVRRPGIAVLPAGSRVVDALEAAGGARAGVDLTSLNLARLLLDGEQILVGLPPPVGVIGSVGVAPVPGASAGPLVDLNVATQVELETLPGVGPVTAEAIMAWRAEHGGFTSVEELLEVDGIGDATLADLAPHVTV